MALLNPRGLDRRDMNDMIESVHVARIRTDEGYGSDPLRLADRKATDKIPGVPGSGDADKYIPFYSTSFQLTGENVIIAVIITDCCHDRGINRQSHGGQTRTFETKTIDQLSDHVLRIRRTSAISCP